jgi:toxin FitB
MFLLDTNVVSELARPQPDLVLIAWFGSLPSFSMSAFTIDELSYGIAKLAGKKSALLRTWFEELLAIPPAIIAVDTRIARAAGELRASRERKGRPVAQADMIIAATALVSGLTLATRNTGDFEGCGVALLNPFG